MRAPARSLVDVTNSETLGHEGELIYVTVTGSTGRVDRCCPSRGNRVRPDKKKIGFSE